MRKFTLAVGVVCGFSTSMAFAEEIVVNSKGEKIKLNDDMTWEFVVGADQDISKITANALGYAMAGDFEAAMSEVNSVKDPENQDMLLLNIWNFATVANDCSVQREIVEKINSASTKGLFAMNLKTLCP